MERKQKGEKKSFVVGSPKANTTLNRPQCCLDFPGRFKVTRERYWVQLAWR